MLDQYLCWCDNPTNARVAGSKYARYARYAKHTLQGKYVWLAFEWVLNVFTLLTSDTPRHDSIKSCIQRGSDIPAAGIQYLFYIGPM